jgi:hypothetical protein
VKHVVRLAALALVVLGSRPASAQTWVVKCFYERDSFTDDPLLVDCRDDLKPRADFVAGQLDSATAWLEGLGFQKPVIEPDGGSYRARAIVTEDLAARVNFRPKSLATYQTFGAVSGSAPMMYLRGWNLTTAADLEPGPADAPDSARDTTALLDAMATPAHELFHAVQAGELGSVGAYRALTEEASGTATCPAAEALSWIVEGTAEAVALASLRALPVTSGGGLPEPSPTYPLPLYDCTDPYAVSHFWLAIGEELGSRAKIEYLKDLFEAGVSFTNTGLDRVHSVLGEAAPGRDGLEGLYVDVIARHANDRQYYEWEDEGIEVEELFFNFEAVSITETRRGELKPVATNAYEVKVQVPEGELAGLKIELPEGLRDDPALHLVVDDERFDRVEGDEERNVYETALSGSDEPAEFLVRVVNVDPNPSRSRDKQYQVEFTLEPLVRCTGRVMMSSVSDRLTRAHEAAGAIGAVAAGIVSPAPAFSSADNNPLTRWRSYEEATGELGLMPTEANFRISGLIAAGGLACADPLGDNVGIDVEMGFMDGNEVRNAIMRSMQNMTPEQRREMARGMRAPPDPQSSDVMERLLGFPFPAAIGDVFSQIEGSTILEVYTPNAMSWILGVAPGVDMLDHRGLGGWPANSASHLQVMIPNTPVSALRAGETYNAVTFAPQGTAMMLFARWQGEWQRSRPQIAVCEAQRGGAYTPVRRAVDPALPYEDAFSGLKTEVKGTLEGTVTITEITGAAVRGSFSLSGNAEMFQTTHEYSRAQGAEHACEYGTTGDVIGDRVSKRDETNGLLTVSGTFEAPAAVQVGRQGRLIQTTRKVGRER